MTTKARHTLWSYPDSPSNTKKSEIFQMIGTASIAIAAIVAIFAGLVGLGLVLP